MLRHYAPAFVFFVKAHFANAKARHLLRESLEIFAELHV